MKAPDSVSVLRTISPKEAKDFSKYLLTRIGESTQSFRLWKLLRGKNFVRVRNERIQDFATELLVSESQARNRLSDILGFYDEYLAVCRIRSSPRLRAALALEQAMETNHGEYLEWAFPRADRLLTDGKFTSTFALYEYLRFKRVSHEFQMDLSNQVSKKGILEIHRVLEEFTLVEKSKLYLSIVSGKLVFTGSEVSLETEIQALFTKLGIAEDEEKSAIPQNIYYHLFRIVHDGDNGSFERIFSNLREVLSKVSARDGRQVVYILGNTLVQKINLGGEDYEAQYREFFTIVLEFPEIKVTEWLLKNFINILCRLGDPELARKALAVYIPDLPAGRAEQARKYNEAVIMIAERNYDEAIDVLSKISLSNDSYYVGARYQLFKALYELRDYVGLLALIKSFRSYMKSLKYIPDEKVRSANLNFLSNFSAMVKLKMEEPYLPPQTYLSSQKKLVKKIQGMDVIINRDWLMGKILEQH